MAHSSLLCRAIAMEVREHPYGKHAKAELAQLDLDKVVVKANPARGLDLAERWCASCHVVSRTQVKGMDSVGTPKAAARCSAPESFPTYPSLAAR